jgi:hypothetical protein
MLYTLHSCTGSQWITAEVLVAVFPHVYDVNILVAYTFLKIK